MTRPRVNKLRDMDDDAIAAIYAKQTKRLPYSLQAREIAHIAGGTTRAIDLACGPGYLLAAMAKQYPQTEWHGLDIASSMLTIAKDSVRKTSGRQARLLQASVFALPFRAQAFDLVLSTSLLHMLDDPKSFFRETVRILSPGGMAIILAFRRDVPEWLRLMGYGHTKYLKTTKQPLEGMGLVFDASYIKEEIEEMLKEFDRLSWEIKLGLMRMTVILRKAP